MSFRSSSSLRSSVSSSSSRRVLIPASLSSEQLEPTALVPPPPPRSTRRDSSTPISNGSGSAYSSSGGSRGGGRRSSRSRSRSRRGSSRSREEEALDGGGTRRQEFEIGEADDEGDGDGDGDVGGEWSYDDADRDKSDNEEYADNDEQAKLASGHSSSLGGGGGAGRSACCGYMLHCCFPLMGLFHLARTRGAHLFWRLLPSVLVAKAFWLSVVTLGLCDLAKIVYVADSYDEEAEYEMELEEGKFTSDGGGVEDGDAWGGGGSADELLMEDPDGAITLFFGLWAYSDLPDRQQREHAETDNLDFHGTDDVMGAAGDAFRNEVDRVATCSYHLGHADGSHVFFMDPAFRTARAFGVVAVGVGGMAATALWLGAMRAGGGTGSASMKWRAAVAFALVLCCVFEGLSLMIFQAGVCGSDGRGEPDSYRQVYRECTIAEGSGTTISACVFWFLTALSVVKMPPPDPDDSDRSGMAAEGEGFGFPAERMVPTDIMSSSSNQLGDDFGGGGLGHVDTVGEALGVSGRRSLDSAPPPTRERGGWRRTIASLASERVGAVKMSKAEAYTSELLYDGEDTDDEGYEGWVDRELQMKEVT